MDPRMRSATSNIAFAVQDQPIADLSAHAPVPSPHLCEFQLPGRPRRKNKRDQKAEHEELSKAMYKGYCWMCQQSCPHLSRRPNALEAPVASEPRGKSREDQKIRNTEI